MALLPVIVLSSLTLPGDVMQAYMVGANAYITKPLDWRYFRCQVHDLGIYWADPAQKPCAAERVESQGSAELAGCSAEHESSTTGKLFEGHSSYPWKV